MSADESHVCLLPVGWPASQWVVSNRGLSGMVGSVWDNPLVMVGLVANDDGLSLVGCQPCKERQALLVLVPLNGVQGDMALIQVTGKKGKGLLSTYQTASTLSLRATHRARRAAFATELLLVLRPVDHITCLDCRLRDKSGAFHPQAAASIVLRYFHAVVMLVVRTAGSSRAPSPCLASSHALLPLVGNSLRGDSWT
eukprot:354809-Pelagomonas_calceolata.AAC.4